MMRYGCELGKDWLLLGFMYQAAGQLRVLLQMDQVVDKKICGHEAFNGQGASGIGVVRPNGTTVEVWGQSFCTFDKLHTRPL